MSEAVATTIKIRALAHGGAGVGQAPSAGGGPTWFVAGALPDETVRAEVEHEAKRFIRGRLLEVLEPSALRVVPPCPLADRCGGCTWQHVEPRAQGRLKRDIVADQLRNVVPNDKVVLAFEGQPLAYRRRARMHYEQRDGALVLGFHRERSRDLVDVPRCPVLLPALDHAFALLREVAELLPSEGEVLGLTDGQRSILGLPGLRPTPELMARLEALLDERLVGIEVRGARSRAVVGRAHLDIDGTASIPAVRASAFVFTQSRPAGGKHLVKYVARAARADGVRVLELFAGAGNFTRALALVAQRVWASDSDAEAVDLLRGLAKARELPINAKKQTAARLLPKLAKAGTTYDVVVLDPPRAGLGEAAMADLARVAGDRIVYVSCDPATLARDLAVAVTHGWTVAEVGVFDLMPMTPQVETVATLVRRRKGIA